VTCIKAIAAVESSVALIEEQGGMTSLPRANGTVDAISQDKSIEQIRQYLRQIQEVRGTWPDGWQSPEGLLLQHGQSYYIGEDTFKGRRGKAKMCYQNASHLMLNSADLIYVEGYVDVGPIPVAHAWCIDSEGTVIDPTLQDPKKAKTSVYPRGYFGIPFSREYVMKVLLRTKMYGLLDGMSNRRLFEGKDSPDEFLAANKEAVCNRVFHLNTPAI
jgi:hypothetical protein